MYFGYQVAAAKMASVQNHAPLAAAIKAASPVQELSFAQQLGQMFSVGLPPVNAELLKATSIQWQAFWLLPAGMAAVIAIIFFATFWDKSADGNDTKH